MDYARVYAVLYARALASSLSLSLHRSVLPSLFLPLSYREQACSFVLPAIAGSALSWRAFDLLLISTANADRMSPVATLGIFTVPWLLSPRRGFPVSRRKWIGCSPLRRQDWPHGTVVSVDFLLSRQPKPAVLIKRNGISRQFLRYFTLRGILICGSIRLRRLTKNSAQPFPR